MAPITDQQWAAARALVEGHPGTHERVAACMGVHVTTVSRRAVQDEWQSVDYRHARLRRAMADVVELSQRIRTGEEPDPADPEAGDEDARLGAAEAVEEPEPWPDEPPAARMARIGAALTRHTERILRRAEAGRPIESRQVAALSSLVALAERIAAMAREEEARQQVEDDEELAGVLDRINDRIVALAEELAGQFVQQFFGISKEEVDARLGRAGEQARGI